MHSSKMRTASSSSHTGEGVSTPPGAGTPRARTPQSRYPPSRHPPGAATPPARSPSTSPLGVGLSQIPLNFPLGCGSEPDPPQLPPWVWAWARSPQLPLGCSPETCQACWDTPPPDLLQGMMGYHL